MSSLPKPPVRNCQECRWVRAAADFADGFSRCGQSDVNRDSSHYLAEGTRSLKRCVDERRQIVGVCGKAGRKWEAQPGIPTLLAPVDFIDV